MEKAIQRQRVLLDHLQPSSSSLIFSRQAHQSTDLSASSCFAGNSSHGQRGGSEDDVVIVAAYRTAICKAKRGGFKDTLPDDLLASVLKAVIEKTKVDPAEVGDIVVGTVLAPGSDRGIECRMAAFYAGFPDTVPLRTVNRQCSSGLQAVADVAAYIKAGFYDIGIGAGLESMSNDTVNRLKNINPKVETFAQARDCLLPMGITSENVAQRYGVTRLEQDQAAVESHKRAAAATASGKFKEEIIPVSTKFVDPKTRVEKKITVSVDDGIRPNTNIEDLAKLKPAFQKDGSTTAGNASQISDGAGAVLLMKRRVAVQKGLPILGIFRHLCSSLGTRYFSHKEQSEEELIRYLDILTVKLGKGSSEEEALHTLLNDETCDAIPLSQNLVHLLLQRYKDDWQSALGVFRWAGSQSSFRHSPESYDMMVDILGRMKVMKKLRDLLDEMRKSGLVTMNTVAKVMRRFVGAGQWVDAVKIFDDLQALGLEKNIDSMNLLLDTLCKEKFVEQAREIFLELKQHIAPNAHTFNIFIHGWCKICRVDEAHWTIEEMKGYGCRPCVISYSTIIRCYCQEGNFIKVYELLDEMQAQGCPANVITYTTIMSALAKAEKFEEALKVPERMRSSGCRADTLFFNSFLYTLGRAGRLDDAAYVFNVEMPKAGVSPNTSTYNSLISMFCYHAQEKRAFEILKEMENSDYCRPDAQTYHPLIKSCFKTGKIDSVLNDILNDMIKKYHLSLDLSTYTLLIHGLCRGDRCNWAFSLFEEMIDQDIIPRFRTCQLLLDEVKQKNMFQAAEKIEDLMKKLSFAAVGVDPAVMGVGPAAAIPAAVKSAGLELGNIDLYEINEAFASQYVYCCKKLGLDPRKVNVNGGAIALGHPLGATGARCVATLLNEMKRRGRDCRYGVISMCIGSGMGAAAVFERGDY